MSQESSFDVKIMKDFIVRFEQDATFENFIGQFQLICPKLLCIVDGTSLRYYDKPGTLPTNIRFDYKQRRGKLIEYYFRDIANDSLYCVFGREAAQIFYPRINDVDPYDQKISPSSTFVQPEPTSKSIYTPDTCSNKIVISVPQEHCGSQTQKTNNRETGHSSRSEKQRISNIEGGKSSKSDRNLASISDIKPKVINKIPNNITIIDKGVKLTFPNPNYPIEVKTYQSLTSN